MMEHKRGTLVDIAQRPSLRRHLPCRFAYPRQQDSGEQRSDINPAGIANTTNGNVSAVCRRPALPSATPNAKTATIGAAASAT